MPSAKSTIEINGKLYNAKTGQPVNSVKRVSKPTHQVIDGFVKSRPARQLKSAAQTHQQRTQKTQTLARDLTPKPLGIRDLVKSKTQTLNNKNNPLTAKITDSPAKNAQLNQDMLQKAKKINRSSFISRFSKDSSNSVSSPASQNTSAIRHATPAIQKAKITPKQQLITNAMMKASTTSDATLINEAAAEKKSKKRVKLISILSTSGAALALVGYFVYINIPNIGLRVAAREAGFEAQVPGYKPPGFKLSKETMAIPGQIQLTFKNQDRSFTIEQKQTNWDSQSLLDNHLVKANEIYQTFQERGLTIYVYGGNRATWVNGGTWYTINGDPLLNTEQMVKIAASL